MKLYALLTNQTVIADTNRSSLLEIARTPIKISVGELLLASFALQCWGRKSNFLSRIASEHKLIERIERKQLELAFAKLNCARNVGLLLQEFKLRCNYGEFLSSLESALIRPRTAQDYMTISKYWNLIEAKARNSAFLTERATLAINWALAAV